MANKFKILTEGDIANVASTKGIEGYNAYKKNSLYCPTYKEVTTYGNYFTDPKKCKLDVKKPTGATPFSGSSGYQDNELIWGLDGGDEFGPLFKKRNVEYVETSTPGNLADAIEGSESCGSVTVVKKEYLDDEINSLETIINNQSVCYVWPTDNPGPNERSTEKDFEYETEDGTKETVKVTVKQKGSATIKWDWGTGNGWNNSSTTNPIIQYVAPGRTLVPPTIGVKNSVTDLTGTTTYTFSGWSPAFTEGTICTADATYVAQYTANSESAVYVITWHLDNSNAKWNDGTSTNKTTNCEYGSTPIAPETPPNFILETESSIDTYGFDEWSPVIATCTGNATYNATFKLLSSQPKDCEQEWIGNGGGWEDRNMYTLTFDPNGGSWSDGTSTPKQIKVEENATFNSIPIELPTKAKFIFDYWDPYISSYTKIKLDYSFTAQYEDYIVGAYFDADNEGKHTGYDWFKELCKPYYRSGDWLNEFDIVVEDDELFTIEFIAGNVNIGNNICGLKGITVKITTLAGTVSGPLFNPNYTRLPSYVDPDYLGIGGTRFEIYGIPYGTKVPADSESDYDFKMIQTDSIGGALRCGESVKLRVWNTSGKMQTICPGIQVVTVPS